jgi:hypothetical protein
VVETAVAVVENAVVETKPSFLKPPWLKTPRKPKETHADGATGNTVYY